MGRSVTLAILSTSGQEMNTHLDKKDYCNSNYRTIEREVANRTMLSGEKDNKMG